jgi:DNA-binding response OmpR family regulator/signal transduction histidine kinase
MCARGVVRAVLVIAAVMMLVGCTDTRVVRVVDGVLDLRAWTTADLVVPQGEYRIDWDTLEPRDPAHPSADRFVVPGNIGAHWPRRGLFNVLQGPGCAVLSADVLMPESQAPVAFGFQTLHARVRAVPLDGSASATEVLAAPISCDPEANEEVHYWQTVTLPQARRVRLEIAVSPQKWGHPNIRGNFRMGSPSRVARDRVNEVVVRIASIGVLIGLAGGALVLAFLRPASGGALQLALLMLVLAIRSTAGLQFVEAIWPRPWVYTCMLTFEYAAMPLGVLAAYSFFDITLGLPRALRKWVLGGSALSLAAVLVAPQAYMTGPVADALKLFTVVVAVVLSPHALRWRDPTEPAATIVMRCGLVALVVGALLDIVQSIGPRVGFEWMPISNVVFAFSQAVIVVMRYAAALKTAEGLVGAVDQVNVELRAQGELVSEFMQSASSELLEPANAVVALADGTSTTHGRRIGDEVRHALELVATNGRRIAYLASELRDMSHAPDAAPASEVHAFDGELLVRRAVETIRPMLSRRYLEVRVSVAEGAPAFFGDLERFERAIVSVLGFGASYAESGHLSVSLSEAGSFAVVTVTANGRFPDPGPLLSAFDTVRRLAGAGLPATRIGVGLATARRTALRHGGSLTVRVTPEVGVVMRLELPAVAHSERRLSLSSPRSARITIESAPLKSVRAGAGGRSVLVVEDDETNRTLLRQALEHRGFEAWLAADGESAIDTIISAGPPHVVLLDVGLPGLSGLQVVDVLRQRFDAATLPILLLTARSTQDDITEGFRRGVNDYLVKPVSFTELEARVSHYTALVDAHRAMRTELEMRRAYEGEIARMAERASHAERAVQVIERGRTRASALAAEPESEEGPGRLDETEPEPS